LDDSKEVTTHRCEDVLNLLRRACMECTDCFKRAIGCHLKIDMTRRQRSNRLRRGTIPHLSNNFKYSFSPVDDEMSKLPTWSFGVTQNAARRHTYFCYSFPSISCQVLAFALLRRRCFTWSSVRHIMMRGYGMVPCHLLVLAGANSVACSCSRSKILQSFLTSAKRKALQSTLQTGLSCNHFIILGLFQFDGRGLGTISYSSARWFISRRYSRFCGRIRCLSKVLTTAHCQKRRVEYHHQKLGRWIVHAEFSSNYCASKYGWGRLASAGRTY
jgi:hypothetical protein